MGYSFDHCFIPHAVFPDRIPSLLQQAFLFSKQTNCLFYPAEYGSYFFNCSRNPSLYAIPFSSPGQASRFLRPVFRSLPIFLSGNPDSHLLPAASCPVYRTFDNSVGFCCHLYDFAVLLRHCKQRYGNPGYYYCMCAEPSDVSESFRTIEAFGFFKTGSRFCASFCAA